MKVSAVSSARFDGGGLSIMTSERFSQIGELLYGPAWRAALAKALGVAERTVRRWAAGSPLPPGLPADLEKLCRARAAEILQAASELLPAAAGAS